MGRRLALLIATYDYQDTGLRALTAPAHDAEAFANVLKDPGIAGFDVSMLINKPHYQVGEAIADLYRDRRRDDLTLLYFTGHGLKDDNGQLYLAMTNTRRDSLMFTSLPAEQIDQAMSGCPSRQKVLILDCCYSGAFPAGRIAKAGTEVHALERFQGSGRTVLTASDATQYAFEGNQPHGTAAQSVFTRYLVAGLRDGSADLDGDGDITLDELYSYVHDRVVDEMPQQHPKKQDNVEGRIVIARNINWALPAHLRHALSSPIATDRLGAVDGLAHLHRVGNNRVRQHALDEMQRLVDDDSRIVSAAAAAQLAAIRPLAPKPPSGPNIAPTTEQTAEEQPPPAHPQSTVPENWPPAAETSTSAKEAGPAPPRQRPWAARQNPSTPQPTQPKPPSGPDEPADPTHGPPSHGSAAQPDLTLRERFLMSMILTVRERLIVGMGLVVLAVISVTIYLTQSTSEHSHAAIVRSIRVGRGPVGVAVSPDGRRAYVTNNDANSVSVIDTGTNRTVGNPITVGKSAEWVAVSPDGRRAYVTNNDANSVSVIDTGTNRTVGNPITVGKSAEWVAVSPDGRRAYVTNNDANSVSVIDTGTNRTVGNPITVGNGPVEVAVFGHRAYVANAGSDSVSVIDTGTNRTVGNPITVGKSPESVAVSRDGSRVYVANYAANSVSVIDTETNRTVGNPITVGKHPDGVAVSRDGSRVYVANYAANSVSVIDTGTNRTVGNPITVGRDPQAVAVSRDGSRAYVTNTDSNTMSVIDTNANHIMGNPIPTGKSPIGVAVSPDGHSAYVANAASNSVSVITF